MWTVGSKTTMKVAQNPEANFPLSIEFRFGGLPRAESSWGMWLDVGDAWYLIRELLKAIAKQKAAEHRVHWIGLRARIGQWFGQSPTSNATVGRKSQQGVVMLCDFCLQEISIGDDEREHCGCEEECPCGCKGDDLHCVYSAQPRVQADLGLGRCPKCNSALAFDYCAGCDIVYTQSC